VSGEYKDFNPKTIKVDNIPKEWNKIAGTYGSPGQKQHIRIEDGYLVMGEKREDEIYLNKIGINRYLVNGGPNDGYEVTFKYDEKGRVKQFELGNDIVPRYLLGSWYVKKTIMPQLFNFILEIYSETKATAKGIYYETENISDFKVDDNKISGSFETPSSLNTNGYRVEFELLYIGNQLIGQIILSRKEARALGEVTPIILSRPYTLMYRRQTVLT
jgi:hypothetical protein